MRRILFSLILWVGCLGTVGAQRVLSLDSCRAMALQGNKQLASTRLSQDLARDVKKAARTKYMPKVDALGGYTYLSREVKLLSDEQQSKLNNLGTNTMTSLTTSGLGTQLATVLTSLGLNPATVLPTLAGSLNQTGQGIVDAFHTDTRSIWAGTVQLCQPLYMGGAIRAANRMADISNEMAEIRIDHQTQETLYDIDKAYWLVVSLRQKQRLAESYRDLVVKLSGDVQKMIQEGVATRADGLKVDVKVNEAEMQITQVENGLSLSRMLLCQLCGMPLDTEFVLEDETPEGEFFCPSSEATKVERKIKNDENSPFPIHNGDGLCYINKEGELEGFRVNRVEADKIYLANGKSLPITGEGLTLYRNHDQQFEQMLSKPTATRKVGVRWLLKETGEGLFLLRLTREDGASVEQTFPYPREVARTPQRESIVQQLSRLGDTPYEATAVDIDLTDNWFIPRSVLAEWRRILTSDEFQVTSDEFKVTSDEKEIDQDMIERQRKPDEPGLLMICRYCIRHELGLCPKRQKAKSEGQKGLFLRLGDGRRFRLAFDCRKCQMKVYADKD